MSNLWTSHTNKPKGLTKADKKAYKNDDLLEGDFNASEPNQKLIGDIFQLPTADGTLYVAPVFDCFDNAVVGLAMDGNMKSPLVEKSLQMAANVKSSVFGLTLGVKPTPQTQTPTKPIFHSDRGSQYTSHDFRTLLTRLGFTQSMSYAKSSCFGNAKAESLIGRFKVEAIYNRYDTSKMPMDEVKFLVFRYCMGYWNNRRISSAIGGMPPMEKRRRGEDTTKI